MRRRPRIRPSGIRASVRLQRREAESPMIGRFGRMSARTQSRQSRAVCMAARNGVGNLGGLAAEAEPPFGHLKRNGMPCLAVHTAVVVQGDHSARYRYVRLPGDHAFGLGDDRVNFAGVSIEVTQQIYGPSLLCAPGSRAAIKCSGRATVNVRAGSRPAADLKQALIGR